MRIKTMVLIVIALVSGLLATIGISQVMDLQSKNSVQQETVKIFVASTDVDINDALNSQNVRLEEWPKDRVPEGALSKLEELDNRFARQRLYAGEPIIAAKLTDSINNAASTIPEGFRAYAIKVSGEVVVGNLVKPGDRVDVVVFLRKNGDVPITGTRTILRDTRVFAVNTKTERSEDDQGQATTAQTVSLLVTPKQVEVLTLASQLGTLRLSLRRPNDAKDIDTDGADVATLVDARYDQASLAESGAPGSAADLEAGNLMHLLEQMSKKPEPQPEQTVAAPPALPTPPVEPVQTVKFKMVVHTPAGLTRYEWTDEKELPQVVPLSPEVAAPSTSFEAPVAPPVSETPTEPSKTSSWLDDTEQTSINVP